MGDKVVKTPPMFIRATTHSLKYSNTGKHSTVLSFISEYRSAVLFYVSWLWDNPYQWTGNKKTKDENGKTVFVKTDLTWDRAAEQLDCPDMISTVGIEFTETRLTARALKCAATQACGIVQAVTNKRIKDQDKYEYLKSKNYPIPKNLEKRLEKPITKPDCKSINCELNSLCLSVQDDSKTKNTSFDLWLNFSALFKDTRGLKLAIPTRHHKQSRKWQDDGSELCNSFLLNEHGVSLRWRVTAPEKKKKGKTVAVDTGIKDLFTCSNHQVFPTDIHNHTFESIIKRLSKCKWGSKGFKRASRHRLNYIKWLVKHFDFTDISTLKLEHIDNIFHERSVNRTLKGFIHAEIEYSIKCLCESAGVQLILVDNEYNSQRCSECGWVHKNNRKGKVFCCRKCGFHADADQNATYNIYIRWTLYELPYGFRLHKFNDEGFYWTTTGLTYASGEELIVPHDQN